jgi:hypothetical protein
MSFEKRMSAHMEKAAKTGGIDSPPYEYPKGWKKPKTLGAAADALWTVKAERLAKDKEAETLKSMEEAYKHYLIEQLPKAGAGGIAGKLCRVSVSTKEVPKVNDWPSFYAGIVKIYQTHVKKRDGQEDGAFALLQRRLGEAAVDEMWQAGAKVDGVGTFTVVGVSLNKV